MFGRRAPTITDQVTPFFMSPPRFLTKTMIKSPLLNDHTQEGGDLIIHKGVTWSSLNDQVTPFYEGGDKKKGVNWSSTAPRRVFCALSEKNWLKLFNVTNPNNTCRDPSVIEYSCFWHFLVTDRRTEWQTKSNAYGPTLYFIKLGSKIPVSFRQITIFLTVFRSSVCYQFEYALMGAHM